MKPQTLKVYQADPETGEMQLQAQHSLQLTADNLDEVMDKARTLLRSKGLLRIRSINAAPNDTIIVYCEAPAMRTETVGGLEIRRPARLRPGREQ